MEADIYDRLLQSSIRFISYRPRSEREIREFLEIKLKRQKTYAPDAIAKVMNRLGEFGYVDDYKFALWWVGQRQAFRPKGERVLTLELVRKGIDKEIISKSIIEVREAPEGTTEVENAHRAVAKKLVLWAKLPSIEQKKKMSTFLAQRGFSWDTIEAIIDEALSTE
jgi:regulatory protein